MTDLDFEILAASLIELGEDIVLEARKNLRKAGKVASGNLERSIESKVQRTANQLDLLISLEDYWIFVEEGRKAGKRPPISNIVAWCKLKGIPSSAAFPIANKIGKKGIPATPFFLPAVEKVEREFLPKLEESAERMISLAVDGLIDRYYKQTQ